MEHKCSMITIKQKDISLKAYSIKRNSEEQNYFCKINTKSQKTPLEESEFFCA